MKIPIFSGAMKTIGCVAVSRGKGKGDHSVLDGVARDVAGGKNILIFPEGTRSASPEMLPFKKGGAIVAIKSGVPILPIGLSGTGRIIPARVLRVTAPSSLPSRGRHGSQIPHCTRVIGCARGGRVPCYLFLQIALEPVDATWIFM